MSDAELIARLRDFKKVTVWDVRDAADRIEALIAMHDTMSKLWAKEAAEKNVLAGQCEDLEAKLAECEARLGKAVEMLDEADRDYNRKTNNLIARHADRIEALKAKLAQAVEVLNALDATLDRNGWHVDSIAREDIRATLAELKGESHE